MRRQFSFLDFLLKPVPFIGTRLLNSLMGISRVNCRRMNERAESDQTAIVVGRDSGSQEEEWNVSMMREQFSLGLIQIDTCIVIAEDAIVRTWHKIERSTWWGGRRCSLTVSSNTGTWRGKGLVHRVFRPDRDVLETIQNNAEFEWHCLRCSHTKTNSILNSPLNRRQLASWRLGTEMFVWVCVWKEKWEWKVF